MPSHDSDKPIQAVETSFRIIEELRRLETAGVTDLANKLELPASTIHNHLHTLCELGYVIKDGNEYQVALRFIHIGEHAKHRLDIYDSARANVCELAQETGEFVKLLVEENGRGVFVTVSRGDKSICLDPYTFDREYLHCTALGKAILANLPRERVEEILDQHGLPALSDDTITDRNELFAELDECRSQGYALDDEERLAGLRCVAAPIKLSEDEYAAVSVSGPTSRIDDQLFRNELPKTIVNTANAISIDVRYS